VVSVRRSASLKKKTTRKKTAKKKTTRKVWKRKKEDGTDSFGPRRAVKKKK